MIKFNNLNNLSEYLKKSDAENIYMKKINSLNISFTELLTSISNKFTLYDYQFSTINNNYNILNSHVDSIDSNLSSLLSSFNTYTSFNESDKNTMKNEISSLLTHSTYVNSEISDLWNAISGGGNNDYNFFKEFGKETQIIYKNFDNQNLILDNEQLEFQSNNLGSYTMINPNKVEYVFCSNVLSSSANGSVNLGGEYSRLGLKIPGDSTASAFTDAIPQNFISATVKSVYIYQNFHYSDFNSLNSIKCLKAYLCNDYVDKSKAFWSISPNLNAKTIDLNNCLLNNANNTFSAFNLNDNVEMISGFGNRTPYISLSRNNGISKALTFTGFNGTGSVVSLRGPQEAGYCVGPIDLSNCYMTFYHGENVNFTGHSCNLIFTSNTSNSYTATINDNVVFDDFLSVQVYKNVSVNIPNSKSGNSLKLYINNLNSTMSYTVDSWNFSKATLADIPYLNFINNTALSVSIRNADTTKKLNLTFSNNLMNSLFINGYQSHVLSLNNNTISTLTVSNSLNGGGVSFGENFRNSWLSISCSTNNTYYSYNNPDATVYLPQGKQKLDYFTAGECNISAGPGMEVAVFSTLNVSALNGTVPYINGGWKYIWANNFNLTNADVFYNNMLLQDYAFFHCPFIQLGTTALSNAINQGSKVLSHQNVLVDNAPTTSIDLRLTGNHTSESVHPEFIHDQKYIISADIRGWHPTRVINFDQSYLFNNVASEYSLLPEYKFTAHVDNVNDWNDYKGFFNPFGDGQGNDRVVFFDN